MSFFRGNIPHSSLMIYFVFLIAINSEIPTRNQKGIYYIKEVLAQYFLFGFIIHLFTCSFNLFLWDLLVKVIMMVRRIEGRRAKVATRCVIAYGKFQASGISGNWSVTFPRDFLPTVGTFRLLSTHLPALSHAFPLIIVPSPSHTFIVVGRGLTSLLTR